MTALTVAPLLVTLLTVGELVIGGPSALALEDDRSSKTASMDREIMALRFLIFVFIV
jgi:hypothetical protein